MSSIIIKTKTAQNPFVTIFKILVFLRGQKHMHSCGILENMAHKPRVPRQIIWAIRQGCMN